jgi:hypothetical protein
MTTSSNFNTPDRIIRMALKDAGLIQDGDDPTSEQFADALNRLNDIINFEQTQGLKLWLQYDLAVPLVAGTNPYTIGPSGLVNMTKPTRVLDNGYYLDSYGNRRPLIMMSRDEWSRLSNPTAQGATTSYFVDKQQTQLVVYFWLVPDTQAATGVAHLLIQQQVSNIVSLTDGMNFPLEWFMWLRWALASDLSTGQPAIIMERCSVFAEGYRNALENWDVEDAATSFAPDQRVAYQSGAFR